MSLPLFLRNNSLSLLDFREDLRKKFFIDHPLCQSRKKMGEMIDQALKTPMNLHRSDGSAILSYSISSEIPSSETLQRIQKRILLPKFSNG